ncbi:hypothetical protein [Shinella sp. HZN7]|uniref:hypothetical protein n=1 Tax=Shinella sp. (strain HZN7) TaxID=879274 RepID=UPI0007DA8B9F|nr:hypothetical protein [Shinella sp. HZN7]ANH04740.1 hypothetical protein shn_12285 [Shinella sp. HZN7]
MRLRTLALAAVLPLFASPLAAAEERYVVCDNGLRCVTAPCPSSAIRNLDSGAETRGVSPDIDGLAEADRQRIRETDALYYGRLVLRGHVEDRDQEIAGRRQSLPVLVVTGIEREATADERRHCRAG